MAYFTSLSSPNPKGHVISCIHCLVNISHFDPCLIVSKLTSNDVWKGPLEMISFCSRLSYNMVDRGILASDWSNIKKIFFETT